MVVWLSIIVIVPFDLESIDSKKQHEILVKRINNICRQHISSSGKIRDATALLLSKLLTRPDVIKSGETDLVLGWLAVEYTSNINDAQ